ncbi:hypothetical protein INT43_005173 [Umbelopsis isabellina]|uniref:UV radiation resistance-associated gene protein n=1 Tax=Mortierella isabellina TaxID=91625 RepID=A0A8H7UBF5_MORIS|nr:hypothetical protein INT43_005173 [Umbelopsis isabellina]
MKKHRSGLHPILGPQQRRIRHIIGVLARNLSFQIGKNAHSGDIYGTAAQKDTTLQKFIVGDDERASNNGMNQEEGSRTSSPSPSSTLVQQRSPIAVHAAVETEIEDSRHNRSSSSSPSAFTRSHNLLVSSSSIPSSPRLEESRLPNRVATPVSVSAMGSMSSLEPPKRVQSGSSIMSLGSTTVEDSSMLRSVYRNSRHASVSDAERGLLDSYVTLHTSMNDSPFYTSEIVANSINPTFRTFDTFDFSDQCNTRISELIIRLWSRNSLPESAAIARDSDVWRHQHEDSSTIDHFKAPADAENFRLLLEWEISLESLTYLCCNMNHLSNPLPRNSIVIELTDGFYTLPDIVKEVLGTEGDDSIPLEKLLAIKPKQSYTYNHIVKLNTLNDCILDTQRSTEDVRNNIEDILQAEKDRFYLARLKGEKEQCVLSKRKLIEEVNVQGAKVKERIEALQNQIKEREKALQAAKENRRTREEYLEESERNLELNKEMHKKTMAGLSSRRKELIADMFSIFPIDQDYGDPHLYHIRGLPLPNSVFAGYDEEIIATALGYTGHLVNMLAYYLAIPLRYPITPMGSRASVRDPISILQGSRNFPLYSRGVDRYRFEYGVFLLNKNIEQLVNAHGLIVMDLRHTLPNVHYLIQAVLTTSVSTTLSPLSVLSISSYAKHPRSRSDPNLAKNGSRTSLSALTPLKLGNDSTSAVDIQSNSSPHTTSASCDSSPKTIHVVVPGDKLVKVNGMKQEVKGRRNSALKVSQPRSIIANKLMTNHGKQSHQEGYQNVTASASTVKR